MRRALDSLRALSWLARVSDRVFCNKRELLAEGVDLGVLGAGGFGGLLHQALLKGGQVLCKLLAAAARCSCTSRRSSRSTRSPLLCRRANSSWRWASSCCALGASLRVVASAATQQQQQQHELQKA